MSKGTFVEIVGRRAVLKKEGGAHVEVCGKLSESAFKGVLREDLECKEKAWLLFDIENSLKLIVDALRQLEELEEQENK